MWNELLEKIRNAKYKKMFQDIVQCIYTCDYDFFAARFKYALKKGFPIDFKYEYRRSEAEYWIYGTLLYHAIIAAPEYSYDYSNKEDPKQQVNNWIKIVADILGAGADPNIAGYFKITKSAPPSSYIYGSLFTSPFNIIMSKFKRNVCYKEAAKKFIESKKIDLNQEIDGTTLINKFISMKEYDLVDTLINIGADVNLPDSNGMTPFHIYAGLAEPSLDTSHLDLLLAHGADINARIKCSGQTPLMVCAENDHFDDCPYNWFLEHGADVNQRDRFGQTALHYLFCHREQDIMSETFEEYCNRVAGGQFLHSLLKHGADPNAQHYDGVTPVMTLLCNSNLWHKYLSINGIIWLCNRIADSLNTLIDYDADLNLFNSEKNTALHYAASNALLPLIPVLLRSGAEINARNSINNTAFSIICRDFYRYEKKLYVTSKWVKNYLKELILAGADITINNPLKYLEACNRSDLKMELENLYKEVTDYNITEISAFDTDMGEFIR